MAIDTLPSFVDSSLLFFAPHALQSLSVESGLEATPETRVSASGQLLGEAVDLGSCGNEIIASTAGRMTYTTDATRSGWITGGTGLRMFANNSKQSYLNFHVGLIGSVAIWFRVGTNGTTEVIYDSANATGGGVGITLFRTTANKLFFGVAIGSVYRFNYTTTYASVNIAAGALCCMVTLDGAGNGTLYLYNAAGTLLASESMTAGGAGAAAGTAASFNLSIGAAAGGTLPWTGQIGTMAILPTAMTSQQRAEFVAYNPALNNAPLARKIASNSLPTDYSNLRMWLDGQGTTYFYQGQNRTTAVSAENDPVRTWACRAPLNVNRDMDGSGAAGTYPLYKPSGAGGVGGIDFDGSNDNLAFNGVWPRAGNWHAFIVAKNDDQTDGSHFWSMASGYLALTGANYGSPNPGSTNPYAVNHCNNGGAVAEFAAVPNSGGLNIHEVRRDGQILAIRTNGREWVTIKLSPSAGNYYSAMGNIGHANANWQLDGMVCEFVLYTVPLPDEYAQANLSYLGAKWSITVSDIHANDAKNAVSTEVGTGDQWSIEYNGTRYRVKARNADDAWRQFNGNATDKKRSDAKITLATRG